MGEAARGTLRAKGFSALWALALMVAVAFSLAWASASGAWADEAAPVADDDVFVALYSRDSGGYTLVFQKGEAARAEYGPLEVVYPLDRPASDGPGDPLGGKRSYVLSAVVADALQPESTSGWFQGLENLEQVDISKLDTSKVKDSSNMFDGCRSLKSIDLSKFDTSSLEEAHGMFSDCSSLGSLNLSKFETSQVTGMEEIFRDCSSLTSLSFPKSFETGMVESMRSMFSGCSSLKALDLSGFDTSRATSMTDMFSGCSSLEIIVFPTTLKTDAVISMQSMFSGCSSLATIDLSKFNTAKVTNMDSMFSGCSSLKSIQFPATFTTSWVTSMGRMFKECSSLASIGLSRFDTSKVTNMIDMFCGCSSLATIDLSKFDTSKVTCMDSMFSGCSSLESLDLSRFDMGKAGDNFWMLSNCSSLGKIILPATGDFAKAALPDWRNGRSVKWRNEKGEVFAADAIPAHTAGTYTAVLERSGSGSDGSGNGNSNGNGSGSNNGSGNGSSSGSGNDSGNGNGSGPADPAPKRTVAFSEAVALPLDATGVAMDKDDIIRDLAKRFGSREGFPADATSVAVTIMHGGKEVVAVDPRRAGAYEVTAVYSMPDSTERVIKATYTVADPAAKTPVKSTVKSGARLAQTGDEMPVAVPLATAALAACALAAAVAVRRRARG